MNSVRRERLGRANRPLMGFLALGLASVIFCAPPENVWAQTAQAGTSLGKAFQPKLGQLNVNALFSGGAYTDINGNAGGAADVTYDKPLPNGVKTAAYKIVVKAGALKGNYNGQGVTGIDKFPLVNKAVTANSLLGKMSRLAAGNSVNGTFGFSSAVAGNPAQPAAVGLVASADVVRLPAAAQSLAISEAKDPFLITADVPSELEIGVTLNETLLQAEGEGDYAAVQVAGSFGTVDDQGNQTPLESWSFFDEQIGPGSKTLPAQTLFPTTTMTLSPGITYYYESAVTTIAVSNAPEPAPIALILLGGLACVRRRRKP